MTVKELADVLNKLVENGYGKKKISQYDGLDDFEFCINIGFKKFKEVFPKNPFKHADISYWESTEDSYTRIEE